MSLGDTCIYFIYFDVIKRAHDIINIFHLANSMIM